MGPRTLGEQPQARLLHHVSGSIRGNVAFRNFQSFPITEARPSSGHRPMTLRCPHCGATVTGRIWSLAGTKRRRIAWLLLAAAGPVLLPLLVANFGQGETSAPGGLIALAFLALTAATIGGVVSWWKEDGVKLAKAPPATPARPTVVIGPTGAPEISGLGGGGHLIGFPVIGTHVYTKQ